MCPGVWWSNLEFFLSVKEQKLCTSGVHLARVRSSSYKAASSYKLAGPERQTDKRQGHGFHTTSVQKTEEDRLTPRRNRTWIIKTSYFKVQLWVTQQNRWAMPRNLVVPGQWGDACYQLRGPQELEFKAQRVPGPADSSGSLCTSLRMLLPACPRQPRGQLEKQPWRLKPLQDGISVVKKKKKSDYKCKILQDPFTMAKRCLIKSICRHWRDSSGPRERMLLLKRFGVWFPDLIGQLTITCHSSFRGSQGLCSTLMPVIRWTSTHRHVIKEIIIKKKHEMYL